ncbi:MAG: transcriptional regulator [Anaerolineae bacterium]|nr:transcriptional regulator [Anaerolineae bacterium]RIK16814.1 MAG: transcriptional regulator [Anaerolineae bacterium]
MTQLLNTVQDHWAAIRPILSIRDDGDYDRAVLMLNELIDEIGTDEQHPLYDFLDTLGTVIAAYEMDHLELPAAGGAEVLAYLMEEHHLRQADLPEVGSQGVVSEILHGKRELSVRQIRALAERFGVSPAVFV